MGKRSVVQTCCFAEVTQQLQQAAGQACDSMTAHLGRAGLQEEQDQRRDSLHQVISHVANLHGDLQLDQRPAADAPNAKKCLVDGTPAAQIKEIAQKNGPPYSPDQVAHAACIKPLDVAVVQQLRLRLQHVSA